MGAKSLIWVPGFEGRYMVSPVGRVFSIAKGRPTELKPGKASHGYLTVCLGRGNTRTVHSLVLEAFVGPRPKGLDIRHLDGDKSNNTLANLCYGTRSENNQDNFKNGARRVKPDDVAELRFLHTTGIKGKQLAALFNISESFVSQIVRGKVCRL